MQKGRTADTGGPVRKEVETLPVRGTGSEGHRDRHVLAVAEHIHPDDVARDMPAHEPVERVGRIDRRSVDRGDDVTRLESGFVGRAARNDRVARLGRPAGRYLAGGDLALAIGVGSRTTLWIGISSLAAFAVRVGPWTTLRVGVLAGRAPPVEP